MAGRRRRPTALVCHQSTAAFALIRADLERHTAFKVIGPIVNGESAVKVADRAHPDVIVTDSLLPPSGCANVIRHLTASGIEPAPTVVVVDEGRGFDPEAAISAGARAFVPRGESVGRLAPLLQLLNGTDLVVLPGRGQPSPAASAAPALTRLTRREREVFLLVARGLGCDEVAVSLGMRESTARSHLHHVLQKLGLRDRAQAVAFAYESRLLNGSSAAAPE